MTQFGWKEDPSKGGKSSGENDFVEDFDPLTLNDDDITVTPLEPEEVDVAVVDQNNIVLTEEYSTEEMVQGYRVQLLSTSREDQAREAKKKAMIKFNVTVYLDYETPNWKIRMGDCNTKKEADALRHEAMRKGFPDAWVVPSHVRLKLNNTIE
jgi:hypothetical protein